MKPTSCPITSRKELLALNCPYDLSPLALYNADADISLEDIMWTIDLKAAIWALRTQPGYDDLVSLYTCRSIKLVMDKQDLSLVSMPYFFEAYKALTQVDYFYCKKRTDWSLIRQTKTTMEALRVSPNVDCSTQDFARLIRYLLNSTGADLSGRVDTAVMVVAHIELIHGYIDRKEFLKVCHGIGDYGSMIGRGIKRETSKSHLDRRSSALRINGIARRAVLLEKKRAARLKRKRKKEEEQTAKINDQPSTKKIDFNSKDC